MAKCCTVLRLRFNGERNLPEALRQQSGRVYRAAETREFRIRKPIRGTTPDARVLFSGRSRDPNDVGVRPLPLDSLKYSFLVVNPVRSVEKRLWPSGPGRVGVKQYGAAAVGIIHSPKPFGYSNRRM